MRCLKQRRSPTNEERPIHTPGVWALALACATIGACSAKDGLEPPNDAGVAVDAGGDAGVEEPPACVRWCDRLTACGLETYDEARCEAACPEALAPPFLERCVPCLQSARCEDLHASCFAPAAACHRAPSVGFIMSGRGFESAGGTAVYGAVVDFAGVPTGVVAESTISEGGFVLDFGQALVPGLPHRIAYFVDADGDGTCDPAVDIAGLREVRTDEPLILLYATLEDEAEAAPEVCAHFRPLAELCARRCEREVACGIEVHLDVCQPACEARYTPTLLTRCIECLESNACGVADSACRQHGGACNDELPPPTATLVIVASGFEPYEGARVRGLVEGQDGRILTPTHTATVNAGRFTFDFGRSFWPGQDYDIHYYADVDGDGACTAADPGWVHRVSIGEDIIFVLSYAPLEMAVEADVCAHFVD